MRVYVLEVGRLKVLPSSSSTLRFLFCCSPLVQFRYFESVDSLSVYLRKVTPNLIVDTWDVHPGLLVDFDDQEQPVALNILSASSLVPVHFYETCEDVNGKPQLQLGQMYDPYFKVLTLRFCTAGGTKDVATSHSNIIVLEDDAGNWVGLRITNVIPPVE